MVGKACLQIMLKFHGRLITPFLVGSMSVRLNILICHYRFLSLIYGLGTLTTDFLIDIKITFKIPYKSVCMVIDDVIISSTALMNRETVFSFL